MGRVTITFAPPPHVLAMPTPALRRIVNRDNPGLRCRILPPDKFFESRTTEYARNLCAGCPILVECGELAIREEMTENYLDGVRGGLSPQVRRAVVRQRRAQAVAQAAIQAAIQAATQAAPESAAQACG